MTERRWQTYVTDMLAKGLGVEDIAVERDVDPALVRGMVHVLRANGTLARIYKRRNARLEA